MTKGLDGNLWFVKTPLFNTGGSILKEVISQPDTALPVVMPKIEDTGR
ncbi:MAG TPA: hypothetical protein VMH28_32245 [Candidatus Acidoferrales bacterium]|nr:hypothetical protein [Candidatus Acidoferrales bacterium]